MERRFVSRLSPRYGTSRPPDVIRVIVCLVAVAFAAQAGVMAQTAPYSQELPPATQIPAKISVLEVGKPIGRERAGRQKDIFRIPLARGQYSSVIIDHRSSDLTIRLRDTQRIQKLEVDTHPGQPRDT